MGSRSQTGRIRGLILAALVLAGSAGAALAYVCSDGVAMLRGDWGQARFRVEIADTGAERAQGLMFRDHMAAGAGMLFVYPRPQPAVAFWMRNTRIPLDIIYMDETGTVQRIAHEAVPYDETALPGGPGIQYVLEINGGLAKSLGLDEGTVLQHPAIGENAAWPCE